MKLGTNQIDQVNAALGLVDREVWIVTAAAGQRHGGLLATWVAPASIDRERPVLLAAIAPIHFTAGLIEESGEFAAHLLREDQTDLAWNFARDSGRDRDKLAGLPLKATAAGPPVLCDCLAWFTCRVFARHDTGDRLYYWADLTAGEQLHPGPPLRQQTLFRGLTPDQRAHLAACQRTDAETLRLRHEAWRQTIAGAAGK